MMDTCWTGDWGPCRHLEKVEDGDRSCSLGLVLGEEEEGRDEGLAVSRCWLTG